MKRLVSFLFSIFILHSVFLEAGHDIEVLSWKPRIFVINNFLSEEECDYLIEHAKPHLYRSLVVDESSSKLSESNGRISSNMFFSIKHKDPVLKAIEERIALVTLIPTNHGEGIQVVHYEEGGEYRPHYDYFDPKLAGSVHYLKRSGQRTVSFLMYLNEPEEGGETTFPKLGINISPVKGKALIFYDCTPDGTIDPLTLHAGMPVIKGEKWLATKWLRQYPFE